MVLPIPPAATEEVSPVPPTVEDLYRRLRPGLVRTAWLLCGDRSEAEDLVQAAFLRVMSTERGLPEHPYAYLRTVVVNLIRDRHRRVLASLTHPVLAAPPVDLEPTDLATWTLIQELPTRQRLVIVLHYHNDLALKDVARLMSCSVPTVKSLLHRGLVRLREEMVDDD